MSEKKVLEMVKVVQRNDVTEAIKGFRQLALLAPEIAKTRIIFFKAYVSEGFTPEQAVELCKNVTGL